MPYVEVRGVMTKVACGPCIRGHRSTKCDHTDRMLVEVRKPGRPLSSCPHPPGSCTCARMVINYTIPKNAACPSTAKAAAGVKNGKPATANAAAGARRVTKRQKRRSIINVDGLEKAVGAQEGDANAAASAQSPVSNHSAADSSDASPSSSHISGLDNETAPRRRLSYGGSLERTVIPKLEEGAALPAEGSCCNGGPVTAPSNAPPPPAVASCCAGKNADAPKSNGLNGFSAPAQPLAHGGAFYNGAPSAEAYLFDHTLQGTNGHSVASPVDFGFNTSNSSHYKLPFQQAFHTGFPSVHIPTDTSATQHVVDHDCECGDGCACLGCAAHPRNRTTTEYILRMSQYMLGPQTNIPPPSPSVVYHLDAAAINPIHTNGRHPTNGAMYSHQQPTMVPMPRVERPAVGYGQHQANGEQWSLQMPRPPPNSAVTGGLDKFFAYSANQSPVLNGNPHPVQSHTFEQPPATNGYEDADLNHSAGQSPESSTPVLSPSDFFLQTLVIPGCTDTSGTCQCGDGCACVGCLTHGGHNGIPLEPLPGTSGQIGVQYSPGGTSFQENGYFDSVATQSHQGGQTFDPLQHAQLSDMPLGPS